MSRFRGVWQSLNLDKEYLFGFETLVFVASGILLAQLACNTPKRKQNLKSYDPFKSNMKKMFKCLTS